VAQLIIVLFGQECEKAISCGKTWVNSCDYPGGGTSGIIASVFCEEEQV